MAQEYDVVILGAGPAGLSAGIYCGRARMTTCIMDKMGPGGQAATTDKIENYPGFPEGIPGFDLSMLMEQQAKNFGAEIVLAEIESITEKDGMFVVEGTEANLVAPVVVIATGARPKELGVPGEKQFRGRGVSYCATCDGAFYRGKHVVVVGGGDSAIGEAIFLTRFADKVYVVHRRDELRATKVVQDRAFKNPKIEFVLSHVVSSIDGQDSVQSVTVKSTKTSETRRIDAQGVFLYVGLLPNSEFVKGFIDLDERGYVLTDEHMRTSRTGVFAAGDVRHKVLRQVVTATSDGAIAAVEAEKYLEERNH